MVPKVSDIPEIPADRNVGSALRQSIERHLRKTVEDLGIAYDPARLDVSHPDSRQPDGIFESLKLGFLQQKLRQLVDRLRTAHAKDARTKRVLDVFPKQTISIDTSGNQGQMRYTPAVVMAIDVTGKIAKNLNALCHELAHCSLPAATPGLVCGHGAAHTEAWLWLLNIATLELGWKFVELSCPDSCKKYNICDPLRQCPGCYVTGSGCARGEFLKYIECKDGTKSADDAALAYLRETLGLAGPFFAKVLSSESMAGGETHRVRVEDRKTNATYVVDVSRGFGSLMVPTAWTAKMISKDVKPDKKPVEKPVKPVEKPVKPVEKPFVVVQPRALRTKRGLGGGTSDLLRKLNVSWMYRWLPDPLPDLPSSVEFVGMKASRWWPSLESIQIGPAGTILMYNEPNHAEQAKMGANNAPGILTPSYAASDWPAFEAFLAKNPGVRLGAPCPAGNGSKGAAYPEPTKWLDEYIAALPKGAWDKIAFTTIHFYGNNVDALKTYVEQMWAKYRKPIWITEFAAIGDAKTNKGFMKQALPWLDAHPHVERYAWYPHSGDALSSWLKGGNALSDSSGNLTGLGKLYRS